MTASTPRPVRAAVMGAGSWGTTFAKVLADAGCVVSLHARRAELATAMAANGRPTASICRASAAFQPARSRSRAA